MAGEAAGLWGAAALYLAGLRSPSPARRFFQGGFIDLARSIPLNN